MRHLSQEEQDLWQNYVNSSTAISGFTTKFTPVKMSRRLDLHGYTVHGAYNKLHEWIEEQIACGNKEVVVITGKSGQISSEFTAWVKNITNVKRFQSIKDKKGEDGGSYRLFLK